MEFVLSCINISIHAPREGSDKQGHGTISPTTHFYPRSPRGERPGAEGLATAYSRISIHAPREGSDTLTDTTSIDTPISIHAPREGSDRAGLTSTIPCSHFYPRSPRGERQRYDETGHPYLVFLSTLPARGATRQIRRLEHIR